MDYESDSSGTDDDFPPSHQNRVRRGPRVGGNGRSAVVASAPYPRLHTDMETQICHLEQEAYSAVLLAFKAQSDTTITWEKTNLMSELRQELNISEDEHKILLGRVDADDNLRRIREWRQSGGFQSGLQNTSQRAHDSLPSPTFSASRKKQKTSHSVPSLPLHPAASLHPQAIAPSIQSSLSAARRGTLPGGKGNKPKFNQMLGSIPPTKSVQYPSKVTSGRVQANEPIDSTVYDPSLIGRKVRTRWPDDNNFYEAIITDYKEGLYALSYDSKTPNETIEWVNLAEIPPEDIRWEGVDTGMSCQGEQVGSGYGIKKSVIHADVFPGNGRGRASSKSLAKKDFPPVQNGNAKKASDDIEILRTDKLVAEVERVFGASHPDPLEMQKAKNVLKEQEQALIDAIAKLAAAYDGNADEGEHPRSRGQSMDRELEWKKRRYGGTRRFSEFEDETSAQGRGGGSDGDRMVRGGRSMSYDQQDDD